MKEKADAAPRNREKNIVICSDGTGNSTVKGRGTNVFKIYEAVDIHEHKHHDDLKPQIAFYDDGVGTETLKPLRLLGGAFGWGLSRNVKELYGAIARAYTPGDQIYLFGFSRGAFTVRTLAGLISKCGIPRTENKDSAAINKLVRSAYRSFRRGFPSLLGWVGRIFRRVQTPEEWRADNAVEHETHAPKGKARIRFIGVWDTVDAVGFPVVGVARFLNWIYCFKFPNLYLPDAVDQACHALSIDDQRKTFHPLLWNEKKHADRIEQVWFPGVHSNVGGGYPKQGVSLVALDWMMHRAEGAGLRFLEAPRQRFHDGQDVNDHIYDSRAGLAVYYRFAPRDIDAICTESGVEKPKLHVSVMERIAANKDCYAPGNLPPFPAVVADHARTGFDHERVGSHANGPLLGKAKGAIGWRKLSHWLMFGFTVALFVLVALEEAGKSGWGGVPDALEKAMSLGGMWDILSNSTFLLWLGIGALAAYGFGLLAKWRMECVFSKHWSGQIKALREALPWP